MAKFVNDINDIITYHVEGEVFTLTLNADDPACDPLTMVRGDGYGLAGWKYTGEKLTGTHTRRFKLVSVGYCRDFDEVRKKLAAHGTPAQGQWREAFLKAYPTPNGREHIGFPDDSWVSPHGHRHFPWIWTDGRSDFRWANDNFDDVWRWLVLVRE